MKNENGITLIELLAVMAISSMVLIIAFSIFSSMMKVNDKSIIQTNLRNETILISLRIDDVMNNTDTVEIIGESDENGFFQQFKAIDKRTELAVNEKGEDVFKDIDIPTDIIIENGILYIDGKKINSDSFSLTNTVFSNKSGGLLANLVVYDIENKETYEINKLYNLQSE